MDQLKYYHGYTCKHARTGNLENERPGRKSSSPKRRLPNGEESAFVSKSDYFAAHYALLHDPEQTSCHKL